MGLVSKHNQTPNQPPEPPPPSSPLVPSGPHDLHHLPDYNPQTPCSECHLKSSGLMFSCKTCHNFTHLHLSCAKFHQACFMLPSSVVHSSHGGCALALVRASAYPGGKFVCNACGLPGDGLQYHCARCMYDLHITCAIKPLKIKHKAHPSCELDLFFEGPYVGSVGFLCNVCSNMGLNQWRYRCNKCDFDVHMDCAIDKIDR